MYSPKIKPLGKKLQARVDETDWTKIPPMLIGFDVYVDVDGNVGFYEGNSIPYALPEYSRMFGEDLDDSIASSLGDKGVIGINVDASYARPWLVEETAHARKLFEERGIEVIMGSQFNLQWDDKKNKFYFYNGSKRHFDFLFNRHFSANPDLRLKLPQSKWLDSPIINPIAHSLILGSKVKTAKALDSFGLETPFSAVVHNVSELNSAKQKLNDHFKKRHSSYEEPFVLVKPLGGTGGKGIQIYKTPNSISSFDLSYPCLISERVSSYGVDEKDGVHMIDTRMFYCNGRASHGVGRVAPLSLGKSTINNGYNSRAFVTNLCKGGHMTRLSSDVEEIMGEYVLAATLAIHEEAVRNSTKLNKLDNL